MSLDKAIKHGKEKRKPYYKSKRFDKTCRPGGSCPYCKGNRLHKHKRQEPIVEEEDLLSYSATDSTESQEDDT